MRTCDTLVIGAGPAGCVIASRLSEQPGHRVLLLEAGPDFGAVPEGAWPPEIVSANYSDTWFDWGYVSPMEGRPVWYKRGRVMGGSSSINAAGINWGLVSDYEDWAAQGNPGWGYQDLLPYFQRVERLRDSSGPDRGTNGMLEVTRTTGDSPYFQALRDSFTAAGMPEAVDVSGPHAPVGWGYGTRNTAADGSRVHAARAYIDPARDRDNLEILPGTVADRLEWSPGGTVQRVHVTRDSRPEVIEAGRVVLAAGSVGTALLLQRSGIGPADLLRRVLGDGPAIHDLPGVGRNLNDHFGLSLRYLGRADRLAGLKVEGARPGAARASINLRLPSLPDMAEFDLDIFCAQSVDPAGSGDHTLTFGCYLIHPESSGWLGITGPHPAAPPQIETGWAHPADVAAFRRGLEWLRDRIAEPGLAPWFERELTPGPDVTGAALEDWITRTAGLFHHCTGTARIGPDGDPLAVCDGAGRVRGFGNLVVGDASLFPSIPRGMIIMSVYAVAEKIAADLAGG